jgi:hypothetical protein
MPSFAKARASGKAGPRLARSRPTVARFGGRVAGVAPPSVVSLPRMGGWCYERLPARPPPQDRHTRLTRSPTVKRDAFPRARVSGVEADELLDTGDLRPTRKPSRGGNGKPSSQWVTCVPSL